MAKSSKKRKAEAPTAAKQTKKQIAIGKRVARQNRIIWALVGALGLLILGVLAVGLIQEFVLKPGESVAVVNGQKVRADDFQEALQYRRYSTHANILNLQDSMASIDQTDEANQFLLSFYEQQFEQLQGSLLSAPQDVLDELIDDALIREKAEEAGIVVTDDDVALTIQEDLENAAAPPPQVPVTDTEQIATPTAVPQEQLDEIYQNALANMGLSDSQFRNLIKRSLYRTKVDELLAGQVATTGLVIHPQLIQTETEAQAAAALERIGEGEEFSAVATEVSTDTLSAADGGDLGWVTVGQLSSRYGEELETQVFALEVGQPAQLESSGMHYVVVVVERQENGPLPEEVVSNSRLTALTDWLAALKASPDTQIEKLLTANQIPPDPYQ